MLAFAWPYFPPILLVPAVVRAQATAMLGDAFPIVDPMANNADTDAALQKHFDVLQEVLNDEHARVRAAAAEATATILTK